MRTPGNQHEIKGVYEISLCFREKARGPRLCRLFDGQFFAPLTWQVVDVAPIHEEMAILGVTQGGHVPRQGHAGTDVPPQGACREGRAFIIPINYCHAGGEPAALIKVIKRWRLSSERCREVIKAVCYFLYHDIG